MKVILLSEVKGVGKINQIVQVSDGYAKNYLLPNNLAVVASSTSLAKNQQIKADEAQQLNEKVKHFQKIKSQLELVTLEFKLKVNKGKVSGAISAKEISVSLLKNFKIEIDKHKFIAFKPINQIGEIQVKAKLMSDIIATFKVRVVEG